jgi:hypothetical protein
MEYFKFPFVPEKHYGLAASYFIDNKTSKQVLSFWGSPLNFIYLKTKQINLDHSKT